MLFHVFLVLCAFLHAASLTALAGPETPRGNLLDTSAIHKSYLEGDFDDAIDRIETARRYGGPFSHEDSVFIFKHLGVMYTAKYETREMGKRHLLQLLQVEPTARILDMYASDMIYMIFKNIKDEFDLERSKRINPEHQGNGSGLLAQEPGKVRNSKAWIGWTLGALATIGTGGAFLYIHLSHQEESPARNRNVVK